MPFSLLFFFSSSILILFPNMHSLSVLNFGGSPLKFWTIALTQFLAVSVEMPEVQSYGTPVDDPNIV